jgi:hypothetical protein
MMMIKPAVYAAAACFKSTEGESPSLSASFFESYSTFVRVTEPRRSRKGRDVGSRPFCNNPSRMRILNPSPEAVDPASRRWRRYAEAPAAAFLTDLRIAVGSASRLRRRYADAPAAASFAFVFGQPFG